MTIVGKLLTQINEWGPAEIDLNIIRKCPVDSCLLEDGKCIFEKRDKNKWVGTTLQYDDVVLTDKEIYEKVRFIINDGGFPRIY